MEKSRFVFLTTFAIILTACGSRGYWTRPEIEERGYVTEADQEQFGKDVFECQLQAHLAVDTFIYDLRKYPEMHYRRQCFMRRGWVKREGKPPHESYYLLRGDKPVTYQSTSYQPQNPVSEIQPQRYTNKVQIEQGCYVKELDKYINPGETICKGGILLECMTDHGWKFRGDCGPK